MPHIHATRELALALKRLIDILVATLGLAALGPLLVLVTLLEIVFHGWPPVYVQPRPGQGGRVFNMFKFRSMTNERDANGELLPDDLRLTAFGRFIRKTSIDELPELFNVLRGDMSLIGPRPLLVRYLERYSPQQARRHEMRPGITGWAQVNGRNALGWDERFALDVWYVDHWSLGLDLSILAKTFVTVFKREGISGTGTETMTEFMGPANEGGAR